MVTNLVDLNVPTKTDHVLKFKRDTPSENFASAGTTMLDLESFMENGEHFNKVYHAEAEDQDEVNVLLQDSHIT